MNANDLRPGMVFLQNSELHEVITFQHVKRGKGPAYIKCKLRVVKTGKTFEISLRSSEKVEVIKMSEEPGRYLYRDGDAAYFLNEATMEELHFPLDSIKDKLDLLREGDEIKLEKAGEEIISIELADFVELKVVQTPPGFKGDTVQATFKPARLETGAVVQVPLFINEGDTIRVSTRTGEYVTRVS